MDKPSEPRSAAISAAPDPVDPVNPSREVPAAPGGPKRVPQSPSARRSPALTSQ